MSVAGWDNFGQALKEAMAVRQGTEDMHDVQEGNELRKDAGRCDPRIQMQICPGMGMGVFAKEFIPAGTYIGPYWGTVYSPMEESGGHTSGVAPRAIGSTHQPGALVE